MLATTTICLTSSTISCSRSDSHAPRRLSRSMLSSTDSCQSANCLLRTKMMQKKCLKRANNTYCKTNRGITKNSLHIPIRMCNEFFSLWPFTDLLLSCKEVIVILLHSRRRHMLGDAFRRWCAPRVQSPSSRYTRGRRHRRWRACRESL